MSTEGPTPGLSDPPMEPVYDQDGNVVAWGGPVTWDEKTDEQEFLDVVLPGLEARDMAARSLAPSLVGLTVDQAQGLVDQHPDLSVVFRQRGPGGYGPKHVFGEISALVEDGLVIRAH